MPFDPFCALREQRHGDGNERLRLSDLFGMPFAGSTGEDPLMADRFASQTKPSPEVLWPDGINHSSRVLLKLTVQFKRHRADWWSQL